MGKLEGKIAVVTGGNSGIGLATAKRFVDEGAYVFITGRRQPELDSAVKSIGKNVTAVQGDVAKLGDLDRLYETVKKEKGRVDILFANAGTGEFAPLGSITEEHYDKIFNANVKGLLFTVQNSVAADAGRRFGDPQRVDRIDLGDAGVQCVQRDESGDPRLCAKLDAGPERSQDPRQ
jgi:NAD(P)-dependent dehydrogenase (short-subunit alcohol dehydrogenase family)